MLKRYHSKWLHPVFLLISLGLSISQCMGGDVPKIRDINDLRLKISHAKAGDTVLVEGGIYYVDDHPLQPAVSGTAEAWITIMAKAGEHVVIDGSHYLSGKDGLKDQRGLPRTGTVTFTDIHHIKMIGIDVKQSHNTGIMISGPHTHHIEIINCRISGSYSSGIGIWYADSCRVLQCEITGANNQAMRPNGIPLHHEAPHEALTVAGATHFEIAENLIHNCFKEGIDCKEISSYGIVRNNIIHDMPRQGLYVDCWFGRLHNITFHHNEVYKCEWGFAISGEGENASMDSIRFHHNILYNNKASGIFLSVWGNDRPRKYIYIYNNTIFRNGSPQHWSGLTGGIDMMSSNLQDVFIYNNIVADNYGYPIGSFAVSAHQMDDFCNSRHIQIIHNLEWQPTKAEEEKGTQGFRKITPMKGKQAVNANPLFISPQTGNFHLQKNSPALHNGWQSSPTPPLPYLGASSF